MCALAIAALCLGATTVAPADDPVQDRFNRATQLLAAGREADAAEALARLAADAPDHRLAPEALYTAAQIYQDQLAEPDRALALLTTLTQRYPDSRPALAASRRAASLRALIGRGGAAGDAGRRFLAIRQGFPDRPEAESIAQAEALLRDHPGWSGATQVRLWLAAIDARAGRDARARDRYLAIARAAPPPAPEVVFQAWLGAGDASVRLGLLDQAEADYRHLRTLAADPSRRAVIEAALAGLGRARGQGRLLSLALAAALASFLALVVSLGLAARGRGGGARALRALWPPPPEVVYLAPALALLTAAAYTGYQGLGPAVALVSACGVAVAWLSGAALALHAAPLVDPARTGARSPRRPRRLGLAGLHAAVAAVAVASLIYVALYQNRLLEPMIQTLRYGP